MTLEEFKNLERSVQNEKFLNSCTDPITYGIEKAAFEQQQLKKLVAASHLLPEDPAPAWIEQWMRQLRQANELQTHLERLRDQLRPQPRSSFSMKTNAEGTSPPQHG